MARSIPPIISAFSLLLIATAVAPGPTPAPLNLTAVLEKGGQYTTLMRLLKSTQVGEQIAIQLNNSFNGMTVIAPTDNAFSNLKAGTLNSLSPEEQVALVLYHVLPRYYSLTSFKTTSNPVTTQAYGRSGPYTLNITSSSNQVNISTGVDQTQVSNTLYAEFPLAVYSVDKVLLPYDTFGPKPPVAAASPAGKVVPKAKAPGAAGGSAADSTSPDCYTS